MFALIHCPNFYIQCERIFRPELIDQTIVIVANNGDGGSRIIASSSEAQDLGFVQGLDGEQLLTALSEISAKKSIKVISANYELYADLSSRFLKSLSLLSPKVSPYACDEAFLDLNGLKPTEDLNVLAKNLRDKLKQWLGVSVFIGVAPTKTLAKLASNAAQAFSEYKGVVELSESTKIEELLALVSVADITGISKNAAGKLSEINVHTALELMKAQKSQVRRRSSVVIERIALELSGLHCKDPELNCDTKNTDSVTDDQTEVRTFTQAKQTLKAQALKAQEQLESLNCACGKIIISLEIAPLNQGDSRFRNALSADLPKATNSLNAIGRLATQLLESLWREDHQYHSLTLSLEGISLCIRDQFGLFSDPISCSRNSIEFSLPKAINVETLLGTTTDVEKANMWRSKRFLLSPSFTTKWGDIPRVS